jgi:hypothetical protein
MIAKFILLTLILAIPLLTKAQESKTTDFYASIKKYDLSKLWRADSIQLEGDGEKSEFPAPLGFIGDNYQRFRIHYVSVMKSKSNAYEYEVQGKTKVKDNICSFTGTITILKAELYEESDDSRYKQGAAICRINFAEDSTQTSSGIIKGQLITYFYIDKKSKLYYDALMPADGFFNNQCSATWISNKTKKIKKCNWGDYRIPESNELDHGVGAFTVDEKYIKSGWENYVKSYSGNQTEAGKAFAIENEQWWK